MPFFNRHDELSILKSIWSGTKLGRSFSVVYGRRRCGKSTLLRRLARHDDVYFLAVEGDAALQRRLFAQTLTVKFPAFDQAIYTDWYKLLNVMNERADKTFTLIIDEFPFLAKSDESLPSILQAWVDDRENRKFNLIICGSSQQMIGGLILEQTAPLFGRAVEVLKIKPLKAGYLQDQFPDLSPEELIEEYAIWGGVPRYWELRNEYENRQIAIQKMLLTYTGALYEEPKRLLLDDIRDIGLPVSLLTTIALGANKVSEIGGRLQRTSPELYRPLNRLMELGYVRKERPYGINPKDKKRVLYVIDDPFLSFYYRFVYSNASFIERDTADKIWEDIAEDLKHHEARIWEDLCRLATAKGAVGEGFHRGGRWWGTGRDGKPYEIDFVAEDTKNNVLLVGEFKWSDLKSDASIRSKLEHKAHVLPIYNGQKIISLIAARSFKEKPSGLFLTPEMVLNTLR